MGRGLGRRALLRTGRNPHRQILPESVSNLTFGGPKLNQLFITAGRSIYTLRVTFNGARYPAPELTGNGGARALNGAAGS